MTSLTIRQAVLTDLATLAPLFDGYRQFYGRDSDLGAAQDFLRARFEHGQSVLFLALDGDTPLGFAQLYPSFSSVSLARVFVLNDLYVVEAARQRGVATGLLNAAADFARQLGAVRLSLSTALTNTAAQAVYAHAGWKRDEQFLVYHLPLAA